MYAYVYIYIYIYTCIYIFNLSIRYSARSYKKTTRDESRMSEGVGEVVHLAEDRRGFLRDIVFASLQRIITYRLDHSLIDPKNS